MSPCTLSYRGVTLSCGVTLIRGVTLYPVPCYVMSPCTLSCGVTLWAAGWARVRGRVLQPSYLCRLRRPAAALLLSTGPGSSLCDRVLCLNINS